MTITRFWCQACRQWMFTNTTNEDYVRFVRRRHREECPFLDPELVAFDRALVGLERLIRPYYT